MSTASGPATTAKDLLVRIQQLEKELGQAKTSSIKFAKPEMFEGDRSKLRAWLAHMDIHLDSQSSKLSNDEYNVMLEACFLK